MVAIILLDLQASWWQQRRIDRVAGRIPILLHSSAVSCALHRAPCPALNHSYRLPALSSWQQAMAGKVSNRKLEHITLVWRYKGLRMAQGLARMTYACLCLLDSGGIALLQCVQQECSGLFFVQTGTMGEDGWGTSVSDEMCHISKTNAKFVLPRPWGFDLCCCTLSLSNDWNVLWSNSNGRLFCDTKCAVLERDRG
jgi:hypothetical protein